MKKLVIFCVCFINISLLFAQGERMRTVTIRGEYTVLETSSALEWRQARELAQEDAKIKAIEKVCGSRISAWEQVETSSAGETFNSLTSVQKDGEVVEFEILKEGTLKSGTRDIETIFYCEAKVTVKRGLAPDPNFVVDVTGLESVYYEGDAITFSIKPYLDCYLKLFLFADAATGYRLYPNDQEVPCMLKSREEISFPTTDYHNYIVTKDTDAPFETNRLVFVFTKDERPFYSDISSRAEIEKWMAQIPNNEKFIYSMAFDIRKR